MKFSQIEYKRPDFDALIESVNSYRKAFENAKSPDEQVKIYLEMTKMLQAPITMSNVAIIRYYLNTTDEFYNKEKDYIDEVFPKLDNALSEFSKSMLASPFKEKLKTKLPPVIMLNKELEAKAMSPEIIDLKVEENKLINHYTNLMSSITIEFDGKKLTRSELGKYMACQDRDIRRESMRAYGLELEKVKDQLDDIFDKMVKVRDRMAKKMGYKDFVELGYYQMTRNCYTPDDVDKFRKAVLKYVVPAVNKLKKKVALDLKIDQMKLYDDEVYLAGGKPTPVISSDEIMRQGSIMYNELDSEVGALYDRMLESETFDVLSRQGKWGGGFCEGLAEFRLPFILSNFNGTADDIDVLTHEMGHAFAFWKSWEWDIPEIQEPTFETCEVHSMSMEFFAHKFMERFFGGAADDYRYAHVANAITFLPYGTIVDYFQHLVYQNPHWTPKERNQAWAELERQFRPYMDAQGLPFFEEGRAWQIKSHIYESPFYYIDYCLAQTVALQFYSLIKQDYNLAWQRYRSFVSKAGSKTFTELLKDSQLQSPFEETTLKNISEAALKALNID
ncbi:MAG TPA: M3 family oligoendopeptidase [Clostridia bacterium]